MSTPKEKYVLADIKNFYLNNDLPDPEYMKFHISTIPQEIIDEYNLIDIVDNNGWLKQAGIKAHKSLINHIAQLVIPPAYGKMKPETPYLH